ncbi:flagellar hook-length control protein FliK [Campylobacter sp. RM16187]|uniref:flagellar hook-length control protein FliK n=1 Tax=Campylobacter sp. RM16187 TaxID=1660063 RepID=UPI0021B6ABA8|nr:flagellar hook-length control protein FliK [Campylobacter sp. RM16187]QKG30229.1 flagellar hook-length control protein [Campylobacter sp. RM16187]
MQTAGNNILSFDASIAGGIKQQTNTNKSDEDSGEFLSMVLEAAANKGENLSERDLKDIANSVNMSAQKKSQAKQNKEIINAKEILGEDTASGLFENATFMQLLQILEMLNGGEKISKFPNFSTQLAKVLSVESNINELKNAKNIKELIHIAKKLNLGLEKITITKEQTGELNAKFPNLAKNSFFTTIIPQKQLFSADLKAKIEDEIELTRSIDETTKLNRLLKEISKDMGDEAKSNLLQDKQMLKNSETLKDVRVLQSQNQLSNENLNKSVASNETIKEAISQNTQKEFTKTDLIKNENLKGDEKNLNSSKINLQTLLYPEKEQSEASGEQNSQNSESELNSMVREIMQNARSQSKNLQLVRQTFDNFNTTLKEQVDAYKSPFMRFNITLNPLNLGEVEITMVNRGNNLHINFNSTTQTMNLFLQNQAEFKASLVNMGFTELEMNFSDQNHKREQGSKAYKGSNFSDSEEIQIAEQPLLEIVLPRYI